MDGGFHHRVEALRIIEGDNACVIGRPDVVCEWEVVEVKGEGSIVGKITISKQRDIRHRIDYLLTLRTAHDDLSDIYYPESHPELDFQF